MNENISNTMDGQSDVFLLQMEIKEGPRLKDWNTLGAFPTMESAVRALRRASEPDRLRRLYSELKGVPYGPERPVQVDRLPSGIETWVWFNDTEDEDKVSNVWMFISKRTIGKYGSGLYPWLEKDEF